MNRPPRAGRLLRGGRLSRLPLRVRLVAGFVIAITVVLTGAGAFVYWRVSYALDRRLNGDLRGEAAALAPLVTGTGLLRDDPGLDRTAGARQYQVLGADGRVLSASSQLGPTALLTRAQARAALHAEVIVNIGALLPRSPRPLRVLTVPLPGPGPARVLLVADRRDERDEALRELVAQLLVAGLGALAVTAVVGERLAKAALAPVERYRTQAASIAAGASGVRLDVPAVRDDEVTRLGHTLNDVLEALEHAVDRERRFTQDASHELRTPLTVLSTRIQLALRRPRTAVEHEAVLHELGQDVTALSALAEQLLTLSTSDETTPDANAPAADLAAVAAQTVAAQGPDSPPVTFTTDLVGGTATVALAEPQLRQVLTNLVANAVLHGGRAPVQVRVRAADHAAVLTVTDAGPGIDPAFLPTAADRFARADSARALPGGGLGLSLVRGLVERSGGELRLCSAGVHHRYGDRFAVACDHVAVGTTASVVLPTC